ncbi:MAG: hypothetical protein IPP49_20240 [Saprospiraceae bacterium]|nr:hypothetical protein [Saprospiraceae bacterium]
MVFRSFERLETATQLSEKGLSTTFLPHPDVSVDIYFDILEKMRLSGRNRK